MVTRKIQSQKTSNTVALPRALLDVIGVRVGDMVSLGIENGKITIAPAAPAAKLETADAVDAN